MKTKIPQAVMIILVLILVNFSCKKEYSCMDCGTGPLVRSNKAPIAIAGLNQSIRLPLDSVLLDGSSSSDPDGTINEWRWTKIAGPSQFNINQGNLARTAVKNLVAGVYQFELSVMDNGGLWARDTMQVVVDDPFVNQPPVANAGIDQSITLPVNTVNLDGSASFDPDNNIISYNWTKISGPSAFAITNANAVQTTVLNLVMGTFKFELKVTDAGGLFSKDTMQVIVNDPPNLCEPNRPIITAQLILVGSLSQARTGMAISSVNNKILFAGGYSAGHSSRVDIYNITTNTWTFTELSTARSGISSTTAGNKVFFAGGEVGDGTWPVANVDIYDASTNTWSLSSLSTAGNSIVGASLDNKVFFAGGDGGFTGPGRETRVDIYDLISNSWSTSSLSEVKRGGHAAVTVNNKVYFAGGETWPNWPYGSWGVSDKIDIYDNASNTWTTALLSEGKMGLVGITTGGKIYWAGGLTGTPPGLFPSCTVDIKDLNNGTSSVQYLFGPASGQTAVMKNNKIIFYGAGFDANKFDIYDIATNSWSIGQLPQSIEGASIISVNNVIYVAGTNINGNLSNQVWKVEF